MMVVLIKNYLMRSARQPESPKAARRLSRDQLWNGKAQREGPETGSGTM